MVTIEVKARWLLLCGASSSAIQLMHQIKLRVMRQNWINFSQLMHDPA